MTKSAIVRLARTTVALIIAAFGTGAWPVGQIGSRAAWDEHPQTAGDLDPAFGNGGIQITDFFGSYDSATSLALQGDGKIVVAGTAFHGSGFNSADFALARYNPDGTLDPTFGAGGKQTTDFFGNRDQANGVAIEPDGKIVAVGLALHGDTDSTADFALARYNPDGTLDLSFGSGGKQTTDFFGNADFAAGVVIQPDGRIVAAGYAQHQNAVSSFALARYTLDGSLDQSFGSGGKLTTDFGNGATGEAVAIQPDGKLVVAGSAYPPGLSSDPIFALARYNPNGSLDQTFGTGGKQMTGFFGHTAVAASVAIEPDGMIVAAGDAFHGSDSSTADFALARYNPNGSLDQSFGAGGETDD
jgi:uncharacterized delta-60 repeat protein